jgi:hypothetical protein
MFKFQRREQHALGQRSAKRISALALSMRMRFSSRTKPEVKDSQSFPAHLESEGVVESFSIVEFSALEHLLEERGPQSSESVELWNVAEQFYLAATAQNLKRLVRHLAQKQSPALTP